VTVGQNAQESIGALHATNAVGGISVAIGGNSTETIGLARMELVAGGKSENTGGSKTETVGVYMAQLGQGLSMNAKVATFNIAGTQRQKIAGSHSLTTKGAAALTASRVKFDASEKITLKCGQAEIILSSSGVAFKGTDVTIEGVSSLKLTPPAIKPPT